MKNIVKKYNLGVIVNEDDIKGQLAALEDINKYDKKMEMDENIQFTWSSQHQTLMNLINE